MKKMLLSLAHPDDESFAAGGTVAKYSRNGWDITLLVVTNGEKGARGEFQWAQGEALGALRQKETEQAAKILGIKTVEFLGYPDGKLSGVHHGDLEDKISSSIEKYAPDIVITHDPTGMNNHPDHIRVCYATTFAFQKYARSLHDLQFPQGRCGRRSLSYLKAEQVNLSQVPETRGDPKLYYTCLPKSVVSYLQKKSIFIQEAFGKRLSGIDDDRITTVIDIKRTRSAKVKALSCHETQKAHVETFLSLPHNPQLQQEYFLLRMQGVLEVFMGKRDTIAISL